MLIYSQLLSFAALLATFVSIGIGTYVLITAPRRASNQAFFLFSLGIAFWVGSYGMILVTGSDTYLVPLNLGGLLLVLGVTRFAQVFPTPKPLPLRPWIFWLPLVLGGSALLLSNAVVRHIHLLSSGGMEVEHGSLMPVWSLLLLTYILISLWFFIRSYRTASLMDRERLWFVYTSIGIFVTCAIVFDAILPGFFGIVELNYLGPLSSLVFLAGTAYGILKHRFLDIRFALQRSAIYSLSFFVLAGIYIAVLSVMEYLFRIGTDTRAAVTAGITILIGIYTLPYLESYFRKVTDPLFFKDRYDYFAVLEELSHVLNTNLSLGSLTDRSLAVLDRTFKPTHSRFTFDCSPEASLASDDICISIRSGDSHLGTYILGPKRSGDPYTRQDRSLLRAFGNNATVAFEKAELYQRLRDHSERLEEKVEERTRDLRELQAQQREFFDDISHALQTPLTVLRSGVELLKRTAVAPVSKTYVSMETSIDDLSRLVRSILELARIETVTKEEEVQLMDLSSTVTRVTEYVAVVAEASDIELTIDITPGIKVKGDIRQIEEVLTNILSNAVKYTTGCSICKIHVSLAKQDGSALLSITDTGIGMRSEHLANVFKRFYRAEQHKMPREGVGLGLAITKRIVERHAGSIHIGSTPDNGTAVFIILPVVSRADLQS